jgi:RNase P protein component
MLQKEKQLVTGKYIFVAKSALLERDHKTLQKDFTYAIKKLELFV